ncbi:MAG: CYTH domain-containing protein [Muribaculaceae bacterium]|nr:CYTH domain-containing protein [Muribaculaceae bacterium]
MGKEIERKFLVCDHSFVAMASDSVEIRQGYLSVKAEATVRVRIFGCKAFITVKGRNEGMVRDEWEYEIPVADAREMLECCCGSNVLEKVRYIVPCCGRVWEVDVFGGRLEGLVIAEVELPSADVHVELPAFAGREVTGDNRYYNSMLSLPCSAVPPVD